VNKEIDWHGPDNTYHTSVSFPIDLRGVSRLYVGEQLVYDRFGEGAWPKVVFPEPPCGWDERDALV
jgi:hypothetical protein